MVYDLWLPLLHTQHAERLRRVNFPEALAHLEIAYEELQKAADDGCVAAEEPLEVALRVRPDQPKRCPGFVMSPDDHPKPFGAVGVLFHHWEDLQNDN
jgi:hypothetical protein